MALATADFSIRPEDGWVLVATNPAFIQVKPFAHTPFEVAVTVSGAPAATIRGLPFGRDEDNRFQAFNLGSAITGEVYVRLSQPIGTVDRAMFGVITG